MTGQELLGIAHMVASLLIRGGQQGDIDFDDLYGAAALGAWRAHLAMKPGYEPKQRRAFIVRGARLEALGYLRKETRYGKGHNEKRPKSTGFDAEAHGSAQSCSSYAAVRLREIWNSKSLSQREKRLLANAAEGVYPSRVGSERALLRRARQKLRAHGL